jgi:phosphatidylserine/phosphatidylglycerophosphate/cardiolipin synthase-like enzyme
MIRVAVILLLCSTVPVAAQSRIELVESIPEETPLDLPQLRNTAEVWLEMIASAENSLDIEIFYLSRKQGELFDLVLEEIIAAANRDVSVRILADASFYQTYPKTLDELTQLSNISVRTLDLEPRTGGVLHAKYFIVDRQSVFTGSQNFDWRSLEHIHELGVRIEDRFIALAYTSCFNMDWRLAREPDWQPSTSDRLLTPMPVPSATDTAFVLPVFSPKSLLPYKNVWTLEHLLDMIEGARDTVRIQLLTYSTINRQDKLFPDLDTALRRAAARGVTVQLLVANWSTRSPLIHHLNSLTVLPGITVKISSIPEHSSGFIPYARVEHAKLLIMDGKQFWIGSSNWGYGYFHNSRNAGCVITSSDLTRQAIQFFQQSWDSPYAIPLDPCERIEPPRIDRSR